MKIVAKEGFILHMLHEQVLFPLELDGHGFEEREHCNVTEAGIAACPIVYRDLNVHQACRLNKIQSQRTYAGSRCIEPDSGRILCQVFHTCATCHCDEPT